MNILVVDDNATNRKLLRAQLEAEGYAVLEAVDGVDALAVLESEPVDALISDILMPHMDGYRLCHRIRRHPKFSALPIILYTSTYESASDRKLAGVVGADRYLIKPAPTPVILQALHEAMQQAGERNPPMDPLPDEAYILHEYSEVLVQKLEARNSELREALEKIRQAHEEILDLNRDLERQVEQRTAALVAANGELESFSYSVSHDLRAPLRHIDGYIELLVADSASTLSSEGRRHLKVITDASRQMGDLIDDLLEFSRMGRAEMGESSVDLDALAREAISQLEMATEGRNIAWQISPLPQVVGDAAMLRQVLANLLGNALKYTGPREAAQIEIGSAGEEDGRVIVFVRDNGVGFDMQYADKLFGVFQRLHRADEFEGTGIGLASVRRIIERHGGRVWAEGKLGEGATFYFTLKRSAAGPA
ncbi:response regulator [Polaromonas sp. P2-4]|nr:response regulator [Polaromonas sp. P2-4]